MIGPVSERVVVVGAGVIGLTCAVRLLERGHDVAVVARDLPQETTSAVAAALWYPHRAYPFERVTAWGATTYAALTDLADRPGTGVTLRRGTEVLRRTGPRPWWADAVPELARATALPAGYADGWTFVAPVVEMPVHLDWLRSRVDELGGTLTRMALSALPSAGTVVDASGLGGRLLGDDGSVQPVRGQVAYVEQVGLDEWWLDAGADGPGPTYVVPREHDIVVGGTQDEGVWDRSFDPAAGKEMLARARELVPAIRRAQVLGTRVGLRPARPQVRLEAEERDGRRVVHCYGHGGAGVTLSWGCADEVADLVSGSGPTPPAG
ncbi:FAD-dependent oxidoreductase [Nocardioides marmoribigeumensis]